MEEKIIIPLSKTKMILSLVGACAFVVAGVWLFLNTALFSEFPYAFFREPLVIRAVGLISIVFFGAIAVMVIRKLSDDKAGLILDAAGIVDNSNATSIGFIAWEDVTAIRRHQVMSTKFLLVDVVDSEKYIKKAKDGFMTKMLRLNTKQYGTPISISSNSLQCSFDELEAKVHSAFDKGTS